MRAWPTTGAGRTFHVIGDVHWGGIYKDRLAAVQADLASGYEAGDPPVCRVQVGDGSHFSQLLQLQGFVGFMDAMPPAAVPAGVTIPGPAGRSWIAIPGNHDVPLYALTEAEKPPRDDRYGYSGELGDWEDETGIENRYVVDFGFVRLIMIGWWPTSSVRFTQEQMTWLDSQHTAAGSQECWTVAHPPLHNTVLGRTVGLRRVYSSLVGGFWAQGPSPDTNTAVKDLLASHQNARAWISGHTHSPVTAPGIVSSETLGGKTVACVNVSALPWDHRGESKRFQSLRTAYVTRDDAGISVRFRDHGQASWTGIAPGQREGRVEL